MSRGRPIDWPSLVMAAATLTALAALAWLKLGPGLGPEPPGLGSVPPLMRLRDPATGEPQVWLPPRGRVTWLVFWQASVPSGSPDLRALQGVWDRLGEHPRFAMLAVAVDLERADAARLALAETGASLPVAVATRESRRALGLDGRTPPTPLHLLIGPDGRVVAVARGTAAATLERLADHARKLLDVLEPVNRALFARRNPMTGRTRG